MMALRLLAAVVFLAAIFIELVQSNPDGAPIGACTGLIPTGHTGTGQAGDAPGGFFIFTSLLNDGNNGAYEAGTTYRSKSAITRVHCVYIMCVSSLSLF